jgi:hypothetical protein
MPSAASGFVFGRAILETGAGLRAVPDAVTIGSGAMAIAGIVLQLLSLLPVPVCA